jgi:hypothetical protein
VRGLQDQVVAVVQRAGVPLDLALQGQQSGAQQRIADTGVRGLGKRRRP